VVFFSFPDDRDRDNLIRTNGYLCDEAITLTNHGLNKARLPGIITQDEAQLIYCCVNTVLRILEGILAPKPTVDCFTADKLSFALEQQDEQLHGYSLQLDRAAGPAELVALDV
jgi:hypothetical protein